jgi:hypothetical protein
MDGFGSWYEAVGFITVMVLLTVVLPIVFGVAFVLSATENQDD